MKVIKINIDGKEIEATITAEDAKRITDWPQIGDEVWVVLLDGDIERATFDGNAITRGAIAIGNMFRTREDAEKEVRARKLIAAIRKRRKELNGDWVPDWPDYDDAKHIIYMVPGEVEPGVTCAWRANCAPVFGYFKREEDAFAVIDEFKDELIWYFTEYANE